MQKLSEKVRAIEYRSLLPATEPAKSAFLVSGAAAADGAPTSLAAAVQQEVIYESRIRDLEKKLAQAESSTHARVEEARAAAYAEGEAAAAARAEDQVRETVTSITALAEELKREQAAYFARVEREVVKLSLAVAARILHREAQMDPLLLTAAVQVALSHLHRAPNARCASRLKRKHDGGSG